MSLPDGFLDELRARLSIGQVVGRKVMWDRRKSNEAKGDLWAPCPFHQEKTASFHVDDRKGFYYCFGCHAKGDAISFVRETENVDFIEAVRILAGEAGMAMPERDPRAKERTDRQSRLVAVMEEAVRHYRLMLRTRAGEAARAYLERRGLSHEAQGRWEIGFAPDDRQGLFRALTAKGFAAADLIEAGLCAAPEDGRAGEGAPGAPDEGAARRAAGGAPYDRFRDRIMFPIRDGRGRAIAFGGRAMAADARAKYLNSPETPLFDKGTTLYNLRRARAAAGSGQPLIVAEGYMDVIALAEAGFGGAVAPLGTAITERQLRLMWRIAPEPVIALDGDAAGQRAAGRLVDLALPLIEAGQSLRFAVLPAGTDPDDLLRAEGPEAMARLVERSGRMVDVLWQRETDGAALDSPERRAAFDKRLRAVIGRIADPSIRRHYADEIGRLRRERLGAGRKGQPAGTGRGDRPFRRDGSGYPARPWSGIPAPARAATRGSALGSGGDADRLLESAILATVLATPRILPEFEDELERMEIADRDLAALRGAILSLSGTADLRAACEKVVGPQRLEKLLAERHVAVTPAVRRPGDEEVARLSLAEAFATLRARRGHRAALDEAIEEIGGQVDEWLTRRLESAAAGVDPTRRAEPTDSRETVTAPNGLALDRQERTLLDDLLGQIAFDRPRRR